MKSDIIVSVVGHVATNYPPQDPQLEKEYSAALLQTLDEYTTLDEAEIEVNIRSASEQMRCLAEAGHCRAMFFHKLNLSRGLHFSPIDIPLGTMWVIRAAEAGDQVAIAECMREGSGKFKKDAEGHFILLQSLDLYDFLVRFYLARAYHSGCGVKTNNEMLPGLYTSCGRFCVALFNLGACARYGLGMKPSGAKGLLYRRQAIIRGHALALSYVARSLIAVDSKGNEQEILRLLESGVERNCTSSMMLLGQVLQRLHRDEENDRVISLYRRALSLGSYSAAYDLGAALLQKDPPADESISEICSLFRLALERSSSVRAAQKLVAMYSEGRVVARDLEVVLYFYRRARGLSIDLSQGEKVRETVHVFCHHGSPVQ